MLLLTMQTPTLLSPLLDDCRKLIIQIPQLHFSHIYREANKSADCPARLGFSLDVDFVLYSSPPEDLISVYEANCRHLFSNRLCTEPIFSVQLYEVSSFTPKKKYCIYSQILEMCDSLANKVDQIQYGQWKNLMQTWQAMNQLPHINLLQANAIYFRYPKIILVF